MHAVTLQLYSVILGKFLGGNKFLCPVFFSGLVSSDEEPFQIMEVLVQALVTNIEVFQTSRRTESLIKQFKFSKYQYMRYNMRGYAWNRSN